MDRYPPEIDRFLPVKPVVFHILLALAESDAHGYGVIQRVRQQSDGKLRLANGPFYRHLRRLLDEGLVEEADSPPPGEGDDPRRGAFYRLTPVGRKVVQAEWHRMAELVATSRDLAVPRGS